MKIGICAWVLPCDELDSFSMASDLGLDGVVINFGQMVEENPLRTEVGRQKYLSEAKKYHVEIPTMAVNTFCENSITQADTLEFAKEIMAEAISVAAAMGIPKLQIPNFYESMILTEEALEHTIEVFKYACNLGSEKGVVIGSENVMTIAQHKKFYEEVRSDYLTSLFDTQNPWRMLNQDGVGIAAYVAPFVGELHAKDSDPKQKGFVPLGQGDVKFKESMAIFADRGYDGWIQLESSYDRGPKLKDQISHDVLTIHHLFNKTL